MIDGGLGFRVVFLERCGCSIVERIPIATCKSFLLYIFDLMKQHCQSIT